LAQQIKITENIHVVPNVQANSYLILESDGLTIIDTGMPFSEKQTLKYISSLGHSADEIKRILITHADLDHYGCLAALKEASGARTYASQPETDAMARGGSSRPVNRSVGRFQAFMIRLMGKYLKPTPIQVDEILKEGDVLPVLGGLQVVETPGHSPGHLSFYAPSIRVLFCGDSMKSNDQGLRTSRSRNNWDQTLANASVRKQSALGAQIVCPGHGPVVKNADEKFPV
jgi:glyoxylase-like metal-dependent hydrolase (beta-lactamase superfamily II)